MPEPKPDQGPEKAWKSIVFPERFKTVFRPNIEKMHPKRYRKNDTVKVLEMNAKRLP